MHESIPITTEHITLGQMVKLANVLESGGMIKAYIKDVGVLVNGEREYRRGRKLYPDDIIELDDIGSFQITSG